MWSHTIWLLHFTSCAVSFGTLLSDISQIQLFCFPLLSPSCSACSGHAELVWQVIVKARKLKNLMEVNKMFVAFLCCSNFSFLLPVHSLSLFCREDQLSLASLTLSLKQTCAVPLKYTFLILSILVTPNVTLNILVSGYLQLCLQLCLCQFFP